MKIYKLRKINKRGRTITRYKEVADFYHGRTGDLISFYNFPTWEIIKVSMKNNKTRKGMQTLIAKWAKKTSKEVDMDCLINFEDKDERSFYFKYDGFLWDCLYYSGEFYRSHIETFKKIFEGTGWGYDYEDASVMIIYREDF